MFQNATNWGTRTRIGLIAICVLLLATGLGVGIGAVSASEFVGADQGPETEASDQGTQIADRNDGEEPNFANRTQRSLVDLNRNNQQNTVISGTVTYEARNGSMVPARQVTVLIRKKTIPAWRNPIIRRTTTDDNGEFSESIDVASYENSPGDNDLHVRIQACAENGAVKVVRLSNALGGGCERTHHIGTDGWVTVGQGSATFDLEATSENKRRSFQIANWALEARQVIDAESRFTRSQVEVNYDDLIDIYGNRYLSHIQKIKLDDSNWDDRKNFTVYHEYGHAVLGGLYGDKMMKIPSTKTWLRNTDDGWFPCHQPYSETDETYAWYEGFAQFHEAVVNNDSGTDGLDLEEDRYFNQSQTHPDCQDGDGSPRPDYDGAKVEGAVANILWNVYDAKDEPYDDLNASLREIYAAVSKDAVIGAEGHNDKRVWNMHDFWDQFRTEDNHAALGRIYFEYGIQKPDRYEGNDEASAAAKLRQGFYHYDSSELPPGYQNGYNISDGAQLNYGDQADHYRFAASRLEWVSLEINSTQGNADADLYVYAPNGSLIAKSTSSDSNESVQFRAPDDGTFRSDAIRDTGTYRFKVNDTAAGRSAGTYRFNLSVGPRNAKDDKFEANHATSGPRKLSETNDATSRATKLPPGEYEDLHLIGISSTDYYAIDLQSNESLEATAEFDHDEADIDLYLKHPVFNPEDTYASVIERSISDTDDERLVWHARQSGTHYLRAWAAGYGGTQVSYDLNITKHEKPLQTYEDNDYERTAANIDDITDNTGGPSNRSGYINAGYSPDDDDYYEIDLNKFDTLEVELVNNSAVDVIVWHPNGLRAGPNLQNEGDSLTVGESTKGTYYIEVTGGDNWVQSYNLSVAHGLGIGNDPYEPNNDFHEATPATPTIGITDTSGSEQYDDLVVDGRSGDEDYFEVQLDSGDTVTATVESLGDGPDLEIIGPEGNIESADSIDSTTSEASMTATTSGAYYVTVLPGANPPQSEEYDLTIKKETSVGSGGPTLGFGPVLDVDITQVPNDWIMVGDDESSDSVADTIKEGNVSTDAGPCLPGETERFTRNVSIDGGQSVKVDRVRSFDLSSREPCKIEVIALGPADAEVNLYVTLDGSEPTTSNYDVASKNPGSNERLVIEQEDGLQTGATLKTLARAYPVSGEYEVRVTIYTR